MVNGKVLKRNKTFTYLLILLFCFRRFVDIDADVRVECIKHAKFFFLHHPELVAEITGTNILISYGLKLPHSLHARRHV